MEKYTITKVRKDGKGKITDVMLNDGKEYSLGDAIQMTYDDKIEGVNVGKSKSGTTYLRSDPDFTQNNNLDNLPTF